MKKFTLLLLSLCVVNLWAQRFENQFSYFDNPKNTYRNYSEYLPASAKDCAFCIAIPWHTILKGKNFQIADLRKDKNTLGLVLAHEASIVVEVFNGAQRDKLEEIEREYMDPIREKVKQGCQKDLPQEGVGSIGKIFWMFPNCQPSDVLIEEESEQVSFMGVDDAEMTKYTVDYGKSSASLCAFNGHVMQIRIQTYRYYDPKANASVFVAFNQVGIDREYELTLKQRQEAAVIGYFLQQAMKQCPSNDVESLNNWLEKSTWKDLKPDFEKNFHLKGQKVIVQPPVDTIKTICPPSKIIPIPPRKPEIVVTHDNVSIPMALVEGGTFTMGCANTDAGCEYNEKPAHTVKIDGFYMTKLEVTQELWEAIMGRNPSMFKNGKDYPVDNVSWNDCQEFIRKLNQATNLHFDLPTEAQWEYAARGGKNADKYIYAGDNEIDSVAWYKNPQAEQVLVGTMPVGSKYPNILGLFDMSGNVMEWCKDKMGAYSAAEQTNPTGPTDGSTYVLRGGSWDSPAKSCRVTARYGSNPMYRMKTFGLRLVLSIEEGASCVEYHERTTILKYDPKRK